MRLSESLELIKTQVAELGAVLASERTDSWMTVPQVGKLVNAIASDLESALDGDETYAEIHRSTKTLEHKLTEKMTAYEWHGERFNVVAFTIIGGSDFDGRGTTETTQRSNSKLVNSSDDICEQVQLNDDDESDPHDEERHTTELEETEQLHEREINA